MIHPSSSKDSILKKPPKSKFVPLGFIIVPTDSEPKLESSVGINWLHCISLNGCSSLICVETWISYFCLPLTIIWGLCIIFYFAEESEHLNDQSKVYRVVPDYSAGFLCGVFIILAAIFMIIGTCRRSGGCVTASIMLLLAAIIVLVVLGMWTYILLSETEIRDYLQKIVDSYGLIGLEENTKEIDATHSRFHCCGVTGPLNWLKSPVLNPNGNTSILPKSCCQKEVICPKCNVTTAPIDCEYSTNTSSIKSVTFHQRGCVKAIRKYYLVHNDGFWATAILSCVVLLIVILIETVYIIRIYARLSNHVHPKIRTLVDEIVDKAEDEIFHVDNDDSLFDNDVKEYLRYNLSRCETIEEVQEFLSATADVRTYIRHLQPEEFARDILSGKPILLHRFEKALDRCKRQSGTIDKDDPYAKFVKPAANSKDDELLQTSLKARKEWKFLSSKVDNYKIFAHRAEDFQHKKQENKE